ncbi:hypothetical protein LTR66_003635 [Elasticomyces elasticus]|nr:hypothetical protein LTR50_001372 [Elasticomyces elasticus]KAK4996848.1 hypothetical protein LTR66_003635 [Elasticomyces elasticus]KAK5009660.1 hypothetical protein LTR28_014066 [Elasticomyces elasticus]
MVEQPTKGNRPRAQTERTFKGPKEFEELCRHTASPGLKQLERMSTPIPSTMGNLNPRTTSATHNSTATFSTVKNDFTTSTTALNKNITSSTPPTPTTPHFASVAPDGDSGILPPAPPQRLNRLEELIDPEEIDNDGHVFVKSPSGNLLGHDDFAAREDRPPCFRERQERIRAAMAEFDRAQAARADTIEAAQAEGVVAAGGKKKKKDSVKSNGAAANKSTNASSRVENENGKKGRWSWLSGCFGI